MPAEETFGVATSQNPQDVIRHRTGGTAGFYGITPIVQPASAAIATLSTLTPMQTSPFGFTTSAQMDAALDQLKAITSALRGLGIIASA